jgi:hypothetical protein
MRENAPPAYQRLNKTTHGKLQQNLGCRCSVLGILARHRIERSALMTVYLHSIYLGKSAAPEALFCASKKVRFVVITDKFTLTSAKLW